MSIDLDAIKKKLNNLQNSSNRNSNIWKPDPGKTQVRIVPFAHNTSNPFIELYFHYNIGKRSTLSPLSFGRPDPIVEYAEKLKSTGDKEDWLMGRKIEPKMRTYVPVIIRGREKEGVKFWGFGKQIYQQLLEEIADPDVGDITDLKNGRDVVITVKTPEEVGKQYAETTVRIKSVQTPATDDKDVIAKIKDQPQIEDLWEEPSYDDLKAQLRTWLGANETDDDDDSSSDSSNIEETFNTLFEDDEDEKKETVSESSDSSSLDDDEFDDLFK